jgi:hypothetical protein
LLYYKHPKNMYIFGLQLSQWHMGCVSINYL